MLKATNIYGTPVLPCRHHAAASTDVDADMRLLCLEWHALRAIETAPVHAPDGIDVEAFFTARARRRAVTSQIMAIQPSTICERQTLARVVAALVEDGEFPQEARR